MATGKQKYSANVTINTELQLRNSRALEKELTKLVDKFDFGTKTNATLDSMLGKVQVISKTLDKYSIKDSFKVEDIKNITKASDWLIKQFSHFEDIMDTLNKQGIKQFSREFIRTQQEVKLAIEKITNNFKEINNLSLADATKNLKSYKDKIVELQKEKEKLESTGFDEQYNKILDEQKTKIQQNKKELERMLKLRTEFSKQESKVRAGYKLSPEQSKQFSSVEEATQVAKQPALTQAVARERIAKETYERQLSELNEIEEAVNAIDKRKLSMKKKDEEAVKLAEKLGIESIENLKTFKELNKESRYELEVSSKGGKSTVVNMEKVLALQTEQNNRRKAALEIEREIQELTRANQTALLQGSGYRSKNALETKIAGASSLSTSVDEESAAQAATKTVNALLRDVVEELTKLNNISSQTEDATRKVAAQTERLSDEGDIKLSTNTIVDKVDSVDRRIQTGQQLKQTKGNFNELSFVTDKILNGGQFKGDVHRTIDPYITALSNIAYRGKELEKGDITDPEVFKEFRKIQDGMIKTLSSLDNAISARLKELGSNRTTEAQQLNMTKNLFSRLSPKLVPEVSSTGPSKLSDSIKIVGNNLHKAADEAAFLDSALDDIGNKVGYITSLAFIMDKSVDIMRQAVGFTKEADKDLSQIGLVLGKTSGDMWKDYEKYSKQAERLNVTTSQLTKSMKLFYQQGLNAVEVNKMVEASAIAAALGETEMSQAAETLTSIINGYNLSASQAMEVTDKISAVSIASAADFSEMSTAIEKVASSAASAGLDLDHMMGYLAKMINVLYWRRYSRTVLCN